MWSTDVKPILTPGRSGSAAIVRIVRDEALNKSRPELGEGLTAGVRGGGPFRVVCGPVGEIVLNASAWEYDDTDRQYIEQLVVALEGRSLGVFRPIGLEGDLRPFRRSAQRAAMRSAPFGATPCSSTMSGCLVWT